MPLAKALRKQPVLWLIVLFLVDLPFLPPPPKPLFFFFFNQELFQVLQLDMCGIHFICGETRLVDCILPYYKPMPIYVLWKQKMGMC